MTFLRALWTLMHVGSFRRLFISRVASQGSDGIFQVALASHVLFNPERAADAQSVAGAFAIVLLPYSLIGPFAGVLLDRWPRRRILVVSQLLRTGTMLLVAALLGLGSPGADGIFFAVVLIVFSVNRFVLAGLGSALPHVVTRDQLVSANSVAPTCGSLAYLLGGGLGTGIHAVSNDAVVVIAAAAGVLLAAGAAARLPFVGPDDDVPGPTLGHVVRDVAAGFIEAARTLPRRARLLLGLVFVTRLPIGFLLLQTLLLFRGPLEHDGGGLGIGLAAGAAALGFASAAFVTPWLSPRLTAVTLAARMLALSALACAALGWTLQAWTIAGIGFVLSLAAQCIKITVDSLLQAHVPDVLLGRAFSAYDVVYNAGLVAGAGLAAVTLPASGLNVWPFLVGTAGYVLLAFGLPRAWATASQRDRDRPLG